MVIILRGVSGSGKTTVGQHLARRLGWLFHDADQDHPPANVEKMAAGQPLTDADRTPWLQTLHEWIRGWLDAEQNAVLACSALTVKSRRRLGFDTPGVALIHLVGSKQVIADRMRHRRGHFFPAELFESQFATFEPPDTAIEISVEQSTEAVVGEIIQRLRSNGRAIERSSTAQSATTP